MTRTTKWIGLALAASLITSCATPSNNYVAGSKLPAGDGLLVVRLVSNWKGNNPHSIYDALKYDVSGQDGNGVVLTNSVPDYFAVVALPGGEYWVNRLRIGGYVAFKRAPFEVRAGQITYIGEIHTRILDNANRAQIVTLSNPGYAKRQLQQKYPGLLGRMRFNVEPLRLRASQEKDGSE